jgi:hypothetical protein
MISTMSTPDLEPEQLLRKRRQGEARKIARDPGNLAYLCGTHHWMYDCGLYPIDAVKLLRDHWQKTLGKPDHKPRMKDAGAKAARKREYQRRGHQAAITRKENESRRSGRQASPF